MPEKFCVTVANLPSYTTTTPITSIYFPSLQDYLICTGRPLGRYPHPRDCHKYYDCKGDVDIVPPQKCPNSLYFSPSILLCTLTEDSECSPISSTTVPDNNASIFTPGVTSSTVATPTPGTWLAELGGNHRAVEENRLVMYYDRNIRNPSALQWPISFTRDLWSSEISMYGNFGDDNRLVVFLRGAPQTEDINFTTYLDSSRGNINTIEVGSSDWSFENCTNVDIITRNVAHIVTQSAKGIRYPCPELKWADIFVYDYYSRTGRINERDMYELKMRDESEDDIATVPLFSQWYLPIYLCKDNESGRVCPFLEPCRRSKLARVGNISFWLEYYPQ